MGGAAALVFAIPLALGMAGPSKGGTRGAEASHGRLPSFETASIKPDELQTPLVVGRLLPGMPLAGVNLSGDNFTATTIVTAMIMDAYGERTGPLIPSQVLGGPAWISTDFYKINAKVNDSTVNGNGSSFPYDERWDQAMLMLRSLLINRFKLRVKHETKVLPVFELVLAKDGAKITEDKTGDRPCRITGLDPEPGLDMKSCDFSTFLGAISIDPVLKSRVLVDRTGLHGRYSFKFHWTAERAPAMQINPGAEPAESSGPFDNTVRGALKTQSDLSTAPFESSLFTALREQLGLKVVSGKASVDVIVIEHIDRPTPD